MAEIVQLDELVPESIIFNYRGKDYEMPGDIDVDTTFLLQQLIVQLAQAEEAVDAAAVLRAAATKPTAIARANREINKANSDNARITKNTEAEILKLFQVNHPELEKLPFGAKGFQVVLAHVLIKLGFATPDDQDAADADPPTPAPKARGSRKTSPRSPSSKRS